MKFLIYVIVSVPSVLVVFILLPFAAMGDAAWALMKPIMGFVDNVKEWAERKGE